MSLSPSFVVLRQKFLPNHIHYITDCFDCNMKSSKFMPLPVRIKNKTRPHRQIRPSFSGKIRRIGALTKGDAGCIVFSESKRVFQTDGQVGYHRGWKRQHIADRLGSIVFPMLPFCFKKAAWEMMIHKSSAKNVFCGISERNGRI